MRPDNQNGGWVKASEAEATISKVTEDGMLRCKHAREAGAREEREAILHMIESTRDGDGIYERVDLLIHRIFSRSKPSGKIEPAWSVKRSTR